MKMPLAKPENKKALLRLVFFCVGGLALLWVVGAFLYQQWAYVSETDARIDGEVTSVASRVSGWVISRPVDEGSVIKKGQVLAEIDPRESRHLLDEIEATLAQIEKQIDQTQAQLEMTRGTTEAQAQAASKEWQGAQAALVRAQHDQEVADADFKRADSLVKRKMVSEQAWDHAKNTYLASVEAVRQQGAAVAAAQARLAQARAAQQEVQVLAKQIEVLRAQHQATSAQRDRQKQDLEDRTLRSPVDGVVDVTFVEKGDYVTPGQWIMLVHDPHVVWVETNLKETLVGRVKVGQTADVHVDAYPGLKVTGKVIVVGGTATNQFALLPDPNPSGNFTKVAQRVPVRIAIPQIEGLMKPGLMVEVKIHVRH